MIFRLRRTIYEIYVILIIHEIHVIHVIYVIHVIHVIDQIKVFQNRTTVLTDCRGAGQHDEDYTQTDVHGEVQGRFSLATDNLTSLTQASSLSTCDRKQGI